MQLIGDKPIFIVRQHVRHSVKIYTGGLRVLSAYTQNVKKSIIIIIILISNFKVTTKSSQYLDVTQHHSHGIHANSFQKHYGRVIAEAFTE